MTTSVPAIDIGSIIGYIDEKKNDVVLIESLLFDRMGTKEENENHKVTLISLKFIIIRIFDQLIDTSQTKRMNVTFFGSGEKKSFRNRKKKENYLSNCKKRAEMELTVPERGKETCALELFSFFGMWYHNLYA